MRTMLIPLDNLFALFSLHQIKDREIKGLRFATGFQRQNSIVNLLSQKFFRLKFTFIGLVVLHIDDVPYGNQPEHVSGRVEF